MHLIQYFSINHIEQTLFSENFVSKSTYGFIDLHSHVIYRVFDDCIRTPVRKKIYNPRVDRSIQENLILMHKIPSSLSYISPASK